MSNKSDIRRNKFMLNGKFSKQGYDWWWHSFTGKNEKTGEEKAFFIEFFTCNPSLANSKGCDKPIFGQTPAKEKPSYVMIKCGAWGASSKKQDNQPQGIQLHRFFAWNQAKVEKSVPFSVCADDCFLNETQTKGSVSISQEEVAEHPEFMCDAGSMSWNLTIDKKIAFNVGYGASSFFRKIKAFEMYWHAEGIKTQYSGWVEFNNERFLVTPESSFGYADKNWGRDFTSPWVWLSSCNLVSKITGKKLQNSAFDIGGGRPKIFFLALNRKLLADFFYEGKSYEFNFSKFWTFTRTKFSCTETETQIIWHIEQKSLKAKMITDISCKKSDMLLVNYEAPNGKKLHNRLWNGGNGTGSVKLYKRHFGKETLIDDIEVKNTGCEYGEYD